jgi:hypothetical protein
VEALVAWIGVGIVAPLAVERQRAGGASGLLRVVLSDSAADGLAGNCLLVEAGVS